MPTYRELLRQTRSEISEIDATEARSRIESGEPVVLDVREQDEWDEGHIAGAVHVPRGHLESRIERLAPDPSRPVVVYCSAGNRSAFAAKTLAELGYEDVVSLAGGFTDWKRNGFPVQLQAGLDAPRRARYSRHLLIPEVGEEGQLKLLDSKVLLVGAGGLGSPALALPRRGGSRPHRNRRRRRRRRVELATADRPLDRVARRAEGRVREADDRSAQTPTSRSSPTRSA